MMSRGTGSVRPGPGHSGALCGFALLAIAVVARGAPAADPRIAHSADPDTVVVSYAVALGEIGEADAGPSVRIYGDGRVETHYPRYMNRAGDHAARLSATELDALLGSLADHGVLEFDAPAARRAKQDAGASRRSAEALAGQPATVDVVSDADTITLEVHVDRAHQKITWRGLRHDARAYADIPAIQGLAAAEREVRAVMERTGRVEP
jgi:hypothetical protein